MKVYVAMSYDAVTAHESVLEVFVNEQDETCREAVTHACQTPSEAMPGDMFECPCGKRWSALEVDDPEGGGLFIEWEQDAAT